MKKKKLTILIMLMAVVTTVMLFLSHGQARDGQFSYRLLSFVKDNCNATQECFVDLKSLTDFGWDEMIYVAEGASLGDEDALAPDIKSLYGIDHGVADHQVVFMDDGKVVYSERLKAGLEHPIRNEIFFHYRSPESIRRYSSDDAFFKIEKVPVSEDGYFGPRGYFLNLSNESVSQKVK